MRIGILSDSHGRAAMTAAAVRILTDHGAGILIHLGDLGSEAVIDELAGHNARAVLGNCDWPAEALRRHALSVGVTIDHPFGLLVADGKTIAFTHGHDEPAVEAALASGCQYLLFGHTHEVRDEVIDGVRWINPGALFRATRYTAAVLDPASDRLEILDVPRLAQSFA
jgi:putative phosphoesterase